MATPLPNTKRRRLNNPNTSAILTKPFRSPLRTNATLPGGVQTPSTPQTARDPSTEKQIQALRSEIDTLQQASKILKSGRDDELQALITKWRRVGREAAEELFASARDRVNRMGGVQGLRERERMRVERNRMWEEEDRNRESGGDGGLGEDEGREEEREGEADGRKDGKSEWLDGRDDDAFTIDMMLQSLNVDLDLIGYDKHEQRWTD